MSNVYISDTDKFESIISDLEKTIPVIEDTFIGENSNFDTKDGTDSWSGKTQEVISEKYELLKENYDPIILTLKNYIKFLKITVENYKKFENTVSDTIEKNEDNLDVN